MLCGSALTFCAPDQVYVAKPNARKTLVRGKPLGRYYEMLVTQEQELSGAAKRKGHEANGGEKIDLENFDKDGQERRRINSPTSVGLFCFCDGLSLFLSLFLCQYVIAVHDTYASSYGIGNRVTSDKTSGNGNTRVYHT